MKTSKKLLALTAALLMIICLCACNSEKTQEDETATVHFDTVDEAYEAMTAAVKEGNYSDAVKYYYSGAVESDNGDTLNWYYYSKALDDYENDGCIGYPLDLLQNMIGDDFEGADEMISELQTIARYFDGVYYGGEGYFLYFSEGKIAVSIETELTGDVICDGELLYIDDEYYWAVHNVNGDDDIQYKIIITDTGLTIETAEKMDSTATEYVGDYTYYQGELPILYYSF
ncbi:MAG: hypothetical protein LUG85_08210 [Clostridiales bacterium]|nr:hypothetical protein [Clostridiales bacterium]